MTAPDFADDRQLPPGQRRLETLKVVHYGRVPKLDLDRWRLTVSGATRDGAEHALTWAEIEALPQVEVTADHHCAARHSVLDVTWGGVRTAELLRRVPPADDAPYALVSAVYGYSANVAVADLSAPRSLLATSLNGAPLTPEHGWPLRLVMPHLYGWKGPKWLLQIEYHRTPIRGFWEQRGYHFTGDVWREERYAHQE
ncbi:MAG: molybdopterin-dependent oxidoreductase [Austwickia sp.]|nr:MAG: molybdopterin-dependent oxidoreductase [Austwickia sp.]